MSAIYPSLPKLAVRDGFDEDDLTDIDDEVFIRDGKNGGLKLDEDGGVKRPLMAPRRKCKKSCTFETHRFPYRALLVPLCYGVIALVVLLGLIVLCIFTANIFPMPLTLLRNWLTPKMKEALNESNVVPCTSLATKVLWTRSLPKLTSESPLRSNDVNGDGVEDIIVGFSTGLDTMDTPEYICALYFDGQVPCLGGVLALNGKTGETLWTHWTAHAIFSVDCGLDLTNDKTKDCVISGRGGILHAINGHDGTSIWEIPIQDLSNLEEQRILDVYDAKFIADADGDGIGDIIASHAVQSGELRTNEILIISGTTGNIIHNANLPDTEQIFLAPQMLVHPDGESIFVLVTSSQKQSGGLYIVPQVNLMYGDMKLRKLHHDTGKGALLPPILVDITLDGVEDIVAAMFNSTIMAYDGLTFEPIWNYTIPNSEIISIPIPGYYNDDDTPDFMVKHQIGSGFPTYYYTTATIIDGKTGKSLLEKPIEDSLSRQMSGLSVTVEGFGNDWFLHWSVDCLNYEGAREKYQFLKGESLISETRADLCKLRFNSTLATNLYALSQHVGPPGVSLYFSEDWRALEFNNSVDPKIESYIDVPFVSERSPKTHKSHRKDSKHTVDDVSSANKYSSEAGYENYADYKGRKKLPPSDFQNDNPNEFSSDYAWKHANKWTRENMQASKDYELTYDSENNLSTGDEQPVDYSQVDEVREQRSDIADDFLNMDSMENKYNNDRNSKNNTSSLTREEKDVNKTYASEKRYDYVMNSDAQNEEMQSGIAMLKKREVNYTEEIAVTVENLTQADMLLNASNNASDIADSYDTNLEKLETSLLNATSPQENISTTFMPTEYSSTTANTTSDSANITESDFNNDSTVFEKSVERTPVYVQNFFGAIENREEDATIEKIFKRESLRNQQNGRNARLRGDAPWNTANKRGENLHGPRKKRETQAQTGRKPRTYGIQKQPPTGILLPSISESKEKTSVDLVFSTFWLPSSEISVILLQEDLDCIHRKKALSEKKLQYKGNDEIVKECLSERDVDYKVYQEAMGRENFRISLGQMTVYRMKLECVCPEDMLPNQSCRNISAHQSWPEHLGSRGNGYFRPLHKTNV